MLSNAYFVAKIRFDTAENEPAKNLQTSADLPNFANPNAADPGVALEPERPARAEVPKLQAGYLSFVPKGTCQYLAIFRQNVARFRLNRRGSLQVNTRFSAFFKIYQIIYLKFLKFGKFCKFCNNCLLFKALLNFHEIC